MTCVDPSHTGAGMTCVSASQVSCAAGCFTSIPPKSFLVEGTIERLLTSSPNYFIRDLKQLYVHGCTAIRRIVVDDENPIFWIFQKSYKFQQWSQEAGNYIIYCGFYLSLTCIYDIWNEFKFSPEKLKILIFCTFWDF